MLTNVEGTVGSTEAVQVFKASGPLTKQQVAKQAVMGITGIRQVLLQAVNRFTGQDARPFGDIEKAKDWLVGPE